jgi:hypothetical protein
MHYRLVKRNSLTELEAAVHALMQEGWRLHNKEHGPTIGEALDTVLGDASVKMGVSVSMQRAWRD